MSNDHNGAGVSPEIFQELIRERKSELNQKTEQKRRHDLRRIQEMKSRHGKHPVEIFPKEIWQMIFDELSPEDRAKMWELHDVFRDVMKNSHTRDNLLPQILKFEVDKFWGHNEDSTPTPAPQNDENDDKETRVPLAHFLELRKLSKRLRNAVDLCIEEELLKLLRQGESISENPKTIIGFQLNSASPNLKKLDEVLDFFRKNPKARFLSRSMYIALGVLSGAGNDYLEIFEQFKNKITSLLEIVGGQILYFSFFVLNYSRVDGSLEATKIPFPFAEWARLMPNLKWFQLHLFCFRPLENCFDIQGLRSQPLPKLDFLERVDMSLLPFFPQQSDSEVEVIPRALLEQNPQIKFLHVLGKGHDVVPFIQLPHVESFELGLSDDIQNIQKAINLNWDLKRLDLCFDLEENESDDSTNSIFKILQHFPSLEKLKLKMKYPKIGGNMEFLKLSNLKELEIELVSPRIDFDAPIHIQFFFSLQFLLYSKDLTKLDWAMESRELGKLKEHFENITLPENMIDFRGGKVDLTKSNMWEVFPRLEYVQVTEKDLDDPRGVVISKSECRRR